MKTEMVERALLTLVDRPGHVVPSVDVSPVPSGGQVFEIQIFEWLRGRDQGLDVLLDDLAGANPLREEA